jgi:hypothetical protein
LLLHKDWIKNLKLKSQLSALLIRLLFLKALCRERSSREALCRRGKAILEAWNVFDDYPPETRRAAELKYILRAFPKYTLLAWKSLRFIPKDFGSLPLKHWAKVMQRAANA